MPPSVPNRSANQECTGFTVPCGTCGAALHLDLALGRTICAYCKAERQFEGDALAHARRHLQDISSLDAQTADATNEADLHRRRQKLGWGWLQPIFPLAMGMYV